MVFDLFGFKRNRSLTSGEKKRLLLLARGKCEYCGCEITSRGVKEEIHHIVPFSSGGSDKEHNLIVLCPNCHSKAEHISRAQFRLKIAYRLPKKATANITSTKKTISKTKSRKVTAKSSVKKSSATKANPKKVSTSKTKTKKAKPVLKSTKKKPTTKKVVASKTLEKKTTSRKTVRK